MVCKKCGADVPDQMNFCTTCGVRLAEEMPENNAEVVMPASDNIIPAAPSEEPKKKGFAHFLIGLAIGLCACIAVCAVSFISAYDKYVEIRETEAKLGCLWVNADENSPITKIKIEKKEDLSYISYSHGYYYEFSYHDESKPNDNGNWYYNSYYMGSEKNSIEIGNLYYIVEFNEAGNEITLTFDEERNQSKINDLTYNGYIDMESYFGEYTEDFSGKWHTEDTVVFDYTFDDFVADFSRIIR